MKGLTFITSVFVPERVVYKLLFLRFCVVSAQIERFIQGKAKQMSMTYKKAGVDYDALDPFKRKAQLAARDTAGNISRMGSALMEYRPSRGESAYLIETPTTYLAHVEEGLGTKNLVADAMYKLTGKSYYDQVAQCTVAMIVNDMVTLGALPISVAMHVASGSSDWFNDETRTNDLIAGWKKACELARCVWSGGETPTLKGVVDPATVVLAGSALGIVPDKKKLLSPEKIQNGDAIVIIESSGIHANGLTLARKIAENLPEGYLTKLSDGRTYGETLLDPTEIYVGLVEDCLDAGIDLHYAVNITGHGWRKLMRAQQSFTYIIDHLPKQLPVFDFIQQHGQVDDREAYGNFNMGAGFALYVHMSDLTALWRVLENYKYPHRYSAVFAGHIEQGDKKVIIRPKGLEFAGDTLAVR